MYSTLIGRKFCTNVSCEDIFFRTINTLVKGRRVPPENRFITLYFYYEVLPNKGKEEEEEEEEEETLSAAKHHSAVMSSTLS